MNWRKWLLTVVVLSSLIGAGGLAQAQSTPVAQPSSGVTIARVYYADRGQLAQLTTRYDVWEVQSDAGYAVVALSADEFAALRAQGYRLSIDLAKTIEVNLPRTRLPGQINGIPGYLCYRTVEETYATAQNIVAAHPDLAEWIDIGDSWDKLMPGGSAGYDLRVLKLTNHAVPGPKPVYFGMSSVHAREYAPAELNTRFAEYLINNYATNPDVKWLLDFNEVHLLLQANPDGRKHAENNLSWRKNTNQDYCGATSTSRGADLNRNWPFKWNSCAPGDGCSSAYVCDATYRGPTAASEPETQATVNYIRSIFPDYRPVDDLTTPVPITATGFFMDLHSYSQLVLWPWGFTYNTAPNATALQTLGRKMAYFNNYDPGQSVGLYPTDGTTDDTAYGELGVPAYTIEMGTTFFQDCASFESTIYPTNLNALVYALKSTAKPYVSPAGPEVLNLSAAPASVSAGAAITLNASANDTRYSSLGGAEPTQAIAAARYSLDVPSWRGATTYPLSASDGAFNASIESITTHINTAGLTPGRHSVFVEAQDAAGNWGVPTAVFITVTADSVLNGTVRDMDTALPIANALIQVSASPTQTGSLTTTASGQYTLALTSGTYTLTASAYGYDAQTIGGVTLTVGLTTTRDISLTAVPFHTLSGSVRDAQTSLPLTATLTIDGYPGGTVNAANGQYSISLASNIAYTLTLAAPGYVTQHRSIGLVAADRVEDFALNVDAATCTAPGYEWLGVRESFTTPITPTNWLVSGTVAGWRFDNPGGKTNLTGGTGGFAIADSDNAGAGVDLDTELRSPLMNLSTVATPTLTFNTDFNYFDGGLAEVADVDVSVDDGATWVNVWRRQASYRGAVTLGLPQAAGQAQVRVRFHYYQARWDAWWQVDDVRLGACAPAVMPAWRYVYLPVTLFGE